jgi:hypothetical protein
VIVFTKFDLLVLEKYMGLRGKDKNADRTTLMDQSKKEAQKVLETHMQSLRGTLKIPLPYIVNVSGISTHFHRLSGPDSSLVKKEFQTNTRVLVEVTRKIIGEQLGVDPWKMWGISCLKYLPGAY